MNKTRTAGWVATAALLSAALIAPNAAFAIDGSNQQQGGIAWDASGFGSEDCPDLEPGEVLWHFIQNQLPEGTNGGKLSGTFTSGAFGPIDNYKQTSTLHWQVITGHTTLLTWSSNVGGTGNLNLSHICVGPEEESASVPVESESASVPVESESIPVESESASVPVESESVPVESESIPVESASIPVESASIPVESASIPVESASIPVESASIPVESASIPVESESIPVETPSGSVDAETGTPDITPPPTDIASSSANTPSGGSWQLVLVGLAALMATALILTPAKKRS